MHEINLILVFLSFASIGAVKFYEGWKNSLKSLGIWILIMAAFGVIVETLHIGPESRGILIAAAVVLSIFNAGHYFYLHKKGYF